MTNVVLKASSDWKLSDCKVPIIGTDPEIEGTLLKHTILTALLLVPLRNRGTPYTIHTQFRRDEEE
jgi:hypothetical protein